MPLGTQRAIESLDGALRQLGRGLELAVDLAHSLHHTAHRGLDVGNVGKLGSELGGVEQVVRALGLDHRVVLLDRKVLPLELGAHNLLIGAMAIVEVSGTLRQRPMR